MWEKQSSETNVTDICLAINGWIFFSLIYVKVDNDSELTIVFLNHRVYEKDTYGGNKK